MATYSLAVTGLLADLPSTIKSTTLPDTSARAGGMALAMRNGTQLLCKQPDGSFAWFTLDAERSTPANPVLLQVGP